MLGAVSLILAVSLSGEPFAASPVQGDMKPARHEWLAVQRQSQDQEIVVARADDDEPEYIEGGTAGAASIYEGAPELNTSILQGPGGAMVYFNDYPHLQPAPIQLRDVGYGGAQ